MRLLNRRTRVMVVASVTSAAVAIGALALGARQGASADAFVAQARARLDAPLSEAPTLDRIQASTAASLLERARDMGREDQEVIGLGHYAVAIEDLQRGDLILAEGELSAALIRLGPTADLHVLAAYLSRGRLLTEQADAEVAQALALDPTHGRARVLAADLALDRGDGQAAAEYLESLVADGDAPSLIWNRLGLARESLGHTDQAEEAFRQAAGMDELGHEPWVNLGRLHRARGHHAEALVAFETAVDRAGSDPDAVLGRGLERAATGDVQGAQEDFARAAELAPNDAEPLLALGDLQRDLGELSEAVETYRAAIAREDADAASWLKLGNVLAMQRHWDEAGRAFDAALRRSPTLAAARNGLGAAFMHTGRFDEAAAELERAAELDAADPNPLLNLALLEERRGDSAAAAAARSRAQARLGA